MDEIDFELFTKELQIYLNKFDNKQNKVNHKPNRL